MALTGQSFLGSQRGAHTGALLFATNPQSGEKLGPGYASVSAAEAEQAVELAGQAAPLYSALSGKERAAFLRRIADAIDAIVQPLTERAHLETALPIARLQGETARTTGQLRLFATLLEDGSWLDARIDTALPDRKPLPRPALRSMLRPIGPVVVFGASNFPLAFSAAGGDTAAALAAGCPVIVKAHSAHPGTSELVAEVIQSAVAECGLPEGVFSLVYGSGSEIGALLVKHPVVQAVAFTGSLRAGRILMDMAASRPQPIPCFTEMSGENPLFILPGAMRKAPETLAQNLFNSFTMGSGQFCTRPGIIFWSQQAEAPAFLAKLKELVTQSSPYPLLTPGIAREYQKGTETRDRQATLLAEAPAAATAPACAALSHLYSVTLEEFQAQPQLSEEIFGPTTLLVECKSPDDYAAAARTLNGQLTATVFGDDEDLAAQKQLIAVLETKAGRVIFNAFPTGVEVSHAMVHGGPYPATSDARFTSVGTQSIYRFARPVCFQGFPSSLLPAELQDANPLGILRLVDGKETRDRLA